MYKMLVHNKIIISSQDAGNQKISMKKTSTENDQQDTTFEKSVEDDKFPEIERSDNDNQIRSVLYSSSLHDLNFLELPFNKSLYSPTGAF